MGELNTTDPRGGRRRGQSNFLLPNGTFFFVLLIFLIVLGVIGKWVVPPISKVLREREAMVAKTDGRTTASRPSSSRPPQADYDEVMADARREASTIRDEARAEGRKIVDESAAEAKQRGRR